MANIKKAFPISHVNGPSKLTVEDNLTGILRSITDFDSYIITCDENINNAKFVIHGYYFEVSNIGNNKVAKITLDENLNVSVASGDTLTLDGCLEFVGEAGTETDKIFYLDLTDSNKYYKFKASSIVGVVSSDAPKFSAGNLNPNKILTTDSEGNLVNLGTSANAGNILNSEGYEQWAYLKDGNILPGNRIYVGTTIPANMQVGDIFLNIGDIISLNSAGDL